MGRGIPSMTTKFVSAIEVPQFRTGVSLHSHTLHSRETLSILHALGARSALVRAGVQWLQREFLRTTGTALDLQRAWWTPPLTAHESWELERSQIKSAGLTPIVSITDHDNIEGPLALRVLDQCKKVPISVEWTVPFEGTFFHVGLHNIPPGEASGFMSGLALFTETGAGDLAGLLACASTRPETLVVLNHPYWDEGGLGAAGHQATLLRFVARYGGFLHAVEVNGLRPWQENRRVLDLAKLVNLPVISGGDRHGIEPNTLLNVTNAKTFAEFSSEIRSGRSQIFVTERYRESHTVRTLQNFAEMAGYLENHAHGWCDWSARVFYQNQSGDIRSFHQIFEGRTPKLLRVLFQALQLFGLPGMRHALKMAGGTATLTT